MALTARVARTGETVESFSVSDEEWHAMKAAPRGTYLMRRTGAPAVLKQNLQGTRWFAAPPGQRDPNSQPESVEHVFVKLRLVRALRAAGFDARVEEPGETPDGEKWEADVFFAAGGRRVALEVQLSPQSLEEYERRTDRYRRSGVKAAWLVNKAHMDQFTLACAKRNGWAPGADTMRFIHRPDMLALALSMRCAKGEPVDEQIRVEVFPADVWPPLQLRLDEFARGLARGALVLSKEKRLWIWHAQRGLF